MKTKLQSHRLGVSIGCRASAAASAIESVVFDVGKYISKLFDVLTVTVTVYS
jgi:hypothetical protein